MSRGSGGEPVGEGAARDGELDGGLADRSGLVDDLGQQGAVHLGPGAARDGDRGRAGGGAAVMSVMTGRWDQVGGSERAVAGRGGAQQGVA